MILESCLDVWSAEAWAILVGLRAVLEKNFLPVVVESDALSVVLSLQSVDKLRSDISKIFDDIFSLSQGRPVTFEYVNRSANVVAHNLTCFAFSYNHSETWDSAFPRWLYDLVSNDNALSFGSFQKKKKNQLTFFTIYIIFIGRRE